VLPAEHAELQHGRGDALDARFVHRADRIAGQHHGRGHVLRQLVVPRHRGLDRRGVAVGDPLSLFDGPHERGRRVGVLLRPGLGGDVPVDGEVRGVALVEVGQHLIAVLLLRDGDVGLGEKRRRPDAVLELPGHRGKALGVGDEVHLLRRDPVFGQQRTDQQGADAVGSVDPDLLARQLRDGRDGGVRGGDQHAGARSQDGGLGEDAEPGPRRLRRNVGDVASGRDVDLALELAGDDRLAAGYLLDRHVQPLLAEQSFILRDVQPDQVDGRYGGHRDVGLLGLGRGQGGRRVAARYAAPGRQDHDRRRNERYRTEAAGVHRASCAPMAVTETPR
jgi:hypothetical protein